MKPVKSFSVFGEQVDVLVNAEMSHGASALIVQTTPPGGGPPPHEHSREDETFTVLEGEFEVLDKGQWHSLLKGEFVFSPRGSVHTFRNVGSVPGRMAVFMAPAGFERFFEQVEGLSPPNDMSKIIEIAGKFGLTLHL